MYKKLFLAAIAALAVTSAQAIVVVNGVEGEDADNASPFQTLQAALDFANNSAETIIEVQTPGPIPGASLAGKVLNHPISIQASPGLFPTLNTALELSPTTGTHLITLDSLNVSTEGLWVPLIAGTSVAANNCIFNANPNGSAFPPGVTAAVPSPTTTATLSMTSCTVIGHIGLQVGYACSEYVLDRCLVIGKPTIYGPLFSPAIMNAMNWLSNFGYRIPNVHGTPPIATPRTLTMNQTIVRGGVPLAWPPNSIEDAYFTNEHNTIGPVVATNCVFDSLNINDAGQASRILNGALPPTQNASSTFKHCTFRSANAFGLMYFPGGQPTTYNFTNCLFDMMNGNYGIYDPNPSTPNVVLIGDANAYYVPAGTEVYGRPAFESTKHLYIGNTAVEANLTNSNGGLLTNHPQVCAQAVTTVPPTVIDKDGNPRPLPLTALASDIGADEIDETSPAHVSNWSIY